MLRNSLLVIVSTILSLVVLELCVRGYSLLFFPKMMVLDDKLGWKHAPNLQKRYHNEDGEEVLVVHNEYGHRGRAVELKKERGTHRVLVLGDSFTEGVQVQEEELFTSRLARQNERVEVINAGVGGYGTVQEYLYLADEGIKFDPDIVMLMVFENDLEDNCLSYYPSFGPRPHAVLEGSEVAIIDDPDPSGFLKFTIPIPLRLELSRNSYLFYFVNMEIYQRLFAASLSEVRKEDIRRTSICGKYAVFFDLVKRIDALVDEHGGSFVMVLIPSREDVGTGEAPVYKPILEFCDRERMSCLDLLDRLERERAKGVELYFAHDIHWTEEGHRVAAEEVSRFMKQSFGRQPSETADIAGAG